MVREFKARNHSLEKNNKKPHTSQGCWMVEKATYLTNQQPFAFRLPFLVRQQKARFVFPAFHQPLQPLTIVDVMSDHKRLHSRSFSFFPLVSMYYDIAPSSSVQRVHRPAFVPVETPRRTRRRQKIVDGRARRSSFVFVFIAAARSEGVRDSQGVPVCFVVVAAFGVFLQMQRCDLRACGGWFGGGG